MTRLGRASIGPFAALRLDIRGVSWPPFAPVPGWSGVVTWCRAARNRLEHSTLIASPRVGRALCRWDRAVATWAEPDPFPPLPWSEGHGPFYDESDDVQDSSWAYLWTDDLGEDYPPRNMSLHARRTTGQEGDTTQQDISSPRDQISASQQAITTHLAADDAIHLQQTTACTAATLRHLQTFSDMLERRDNDDCARLWTRLDEDLDCDAYASACGEETFRVAFPAQTTSEPERPRVHAERNLEARPDQFTREGAYPHGGGNLEEHGERAVAQGREGAAGFPSNTRALHDRVNTAVARIETRVYEDLDNEAFAKLLRRRRAGGFLPEATS